LLSNAKYPKVTDFSFDGDQGKVQLKPTKLTRCQKMLSAGDGSKLPNK
jgi:hypothetical protein